MIKIIDEQENYLLVTDGADFTVIERRAGKFYQLGSGARRGLALDGAEMAELSHTERDARDLLAEVATQWRDLFEHVR